MCSKATCYYKSTMDAVKRVSNEIESGRMPTMIGATSTVERCAIKLRTLATLAYVNKESAYLINSIVEVADALQDAADGKAKLQKYEVPYKATSAELMKKFYATLNEVEGE